MVTELYTTSMALDLWLEIWVVLEWAGRGDLVFSEKQKWKVSRGKGFNKGREWEGG